jgi:hypothetical protein
MTEQLTTEEMTMSKWYKQGFKDAIDGLPSDPPMTPKSQSYHDYREGFADGERQLDENEREEERRRMIVQDYISEGLGE